MGRKNRFGKNDREGEKERKKERRKGSYVKNVRIILRQFDLTQRIVDTLHLDNNTSPFETSTDSYVHL